MESLRKRLNFSNPSFQLQVLRDLQKNVEDKLIRLAKSQQQHLLDKVPELDLLVDLVASDDQPLSTPSADIICSLVFKELLDSEAAIAKLLNSVNNARDLASVCHCLSRILVHDALEATVDADTQPPRGTCGSNRSSGMHRRLPLVASGRLHPFIRVLSSRSSAHCALLHEVEDMFRSADVRVSSSALQVTGPFVKYVLLNPDLSGSAARLGMQNIMAGQWASGCDSSREFILHVIPAMPCDSQLDKICMSDFVVQIIRCALATQCHTSSASQLVQLFDLALSVCDRLSCAYASVDVARAAHALLNEGLVPLIAKHDSKMCTDKCLPSTTGFSPERHLLVVGRLLLSSSPLSAEPFLDIVEIMLSKLGWDSPPACLCSTLMLPLLSIMSLTTATITAGASAGASVAAKAAKVLHLIEATRSNAGVAEKEAAAEQTLAGQALGGEDYSDAAVTAIAWQLEQEPDSALPWLCNLACFAEQGGKLPASCVLLLAAIVHRSTDEPTLIVALDAVAASCASQPERAHGFVSLLLYKMRDIGTPAECLALLAALPQLAVHKFTASVVVQALSSMAVRMPGLRPVVLRLLTRIWQKHDRFFATLLDMLSSTTNVGQRANDENDDALAELAVSRAACAADVCRTRPDEHGPDVLPVLSDILSHSSSMPHGELACSLALDGIRALCEMEVVNVKSVWAMLEPLLVKETRGPVLESVCRLLTVAVSSKDLPGSLDFIEQALAVLWGYAQGHQELQQFALWPSVVGAAYSSLAAFPNELTAYRHLPTQVVRQYAPGAFLVDPETGACTLSEGPVDADCIVVGMLALLPTRDPAAREGFGKFLVASLGREIASLPRHTLSRYDQLKRGTGSGSALPKVVTSLPARLMMMHQAAVASHQPSGHIANALLYCYDPRLADLETSGSVTTVAPKPRDLVIWMRMYEKALQDFICHVPPPSGAAHDWQRSQQLPLAWQAFLTRVFAATVVGRRAELSMQAAKSSGPVAGATAAGRQSAAHSNITEVGGSPGTAGTPVDDDDDDTEAMAALHWSRSRLHDLIRTAGRQNGAAQANAMLAHAALCVALVKVGYAAGQGQSSDESEAAAAAARGRSWLRESFDALMAASDGRSDADSGHSNARGGSCATWWPLARQWPCRGAACLALAHVAGSLPWREAEYAGRAVSLLGKLLLQCQDTHQESMCSTALGHLLATLLEHDLNEAVDVETATTVWKMLETFEGHCLNGSINHREQQAADGTASLAGLALCIAVTADSQHPHMQAHSRCLLSKLLGALDAAASTSCTVGRDDRLSMLRYCLAAIASPLIKRNTLTLDESKKIVAMIADGWSDSSKTNEAWAAAVGAMGWACMSAACSSTVFPVVKDIVTQWEHIARSLDASIEQRSAAIVGLMAMAGHDDWLHKAGTAEPKTSLHLASADAIVSVFEPPIDGDQKPRKRGKEKMELRGEFCTLYWQLGRLHWGASASAYSLGADRGYGPVSYRPVLPPSSILCSIVESLQSAATHGPSVGVAPSTSRGDTMLLLQSLATAVAGRLVPPLDWLSLLSPFMYWSADDDGAEDTERTASTTCLGEACLKLATEQALNSRACSAFLARWCAPHLYKTLKPVCQDYLLRNFHRFCNALPRERAQEFMKQCCLPAVAEVRMPRSALVLQSCKDALASCSSYAPGMQLLYYQSVEIMFAQLPAVACGTDTQGVLLPQPGSAGASASPQGQLMQLFADCLLHMEDTFIDQLFLSRQATCISDGVSNRRKCTYLRLLLVQRGRLPLNSAVTGVNVIASDLEQLPAMWLLEHIAACFRGPHDHRERMDWLLKFSKDISLALKSFTSTDQWSQAVDAALCVLVAAAAEWSGAMPWCLLVGPAGRRRRAEEVAAAAMPQVLALLVGGSEPWSQVAPKIFEWLLDCSRLRLPPLWQASVSASIQGLRRCAFFQKQQLWERLPQVF